MAVHKSSSLVGRWEAGRDRKAPGSSWASQPGACSISKRLCLPTVEDEDQLLRSSNLYTHTLAHTCLHSLCVCAQIQTPPQQTHHTFTHTYNFLKREEGPSGVDFFFFSSAPLPNGGWMLNEPLSTSSLKRFVNWLVGKQELIF